MGIRSVQKLAAYFGLILACAAWGIAFVPQRTAMAYMGPFTFGAIRFFIGGLILLAVSSYCYRRLPPKEIWRKGLLLGFILYAAISAQQIGIQDTTAGNAGFITGLYLIFVPLQLSLFSGARIGAQLWTGSILALIGLGFLSINERLILNPADIWILACALFLTQHILLVDNLVRTVKPLELASVQYMYAAILSAMSATAFETIVPVSIANAGPELFYGSVISVVFAYTVQLIAQQHIPPTQAAVIFSVESLFAAGAGWVILDEGFTPIQLFGALFIFLGTILASTTPTTVVATKDVHH